MEQLMEVVLQEIAISRGEETAQELGPTDLENKFIYWINYVMECAETSIFPSENVIKVVLMAEKELINVRSEVKELLKAMKKIIEQAKEQGYDPLFPGLVV
jgi:hypothetical protein